MCSSSIDTITNTTSGYLECGLGGLEVVLGGLEVVWGVSTDRFKLVPRFIGKTRITGKTTEIPERPKNNREILICPSPIKRTFVD